MDRGHFIVEAGLIDWTLDKSEGSRTDTFIAGDVLLRYGLTNSLEAQIAWQAIGILRERNAEGSAHKSTSTGDLRLAIRQNIINPDGSDFSIAIMPYVTIPTGGSAIGEGDWAAGLVVPISYELPKDISVSITAEIDAATDEHGSGHHLAYSGVAGLELPLGEDLNATVEIAAQRDEESGRRKTQWLAGVSTAWSTSESLQLDAGANLGLNRHAPDVELYGGIASRF